MPQSAVSRSYVTYEYYQNDYGGMTITADRFQVCTAWASRLVDRITFGRVAKLSDAECPDFVRDAVCAAADIYSSGMDAAERAVQSERNDGYSVTYANAKEISSVSREARSAAMMYLANSGLVYRGAIPTAESIARGEKC